MNNKGIQASSLPQWSQQITSLKESRKLDSLWISLANDPGKAAAMFLTIIFLIGIWKKE